MIRQVRLTPAARRDLMRLVDFLIDKSPLAAERAGAAIEAGVRSLAQFTDRGSRTPVEDLRELKVRFGRRVYVIQYRMGAEVVVVARIFHNLEQR